MHRDGSLAASHEAGKNSMYMVQDTYDTYATMRPTEILVQESSAILLCCSKMAALPPEQGGRLHQLLTAKAAASSLPPSLSLLCDKGREW